MWELEFGATLRFVLLLGLLKLLVQGLLQPQADAAWQPTGFSWCESTVFLSTCPHNFCHGYYLFQNSLWMLGVDPTVGQSILYGVN